MEVRLTRRDITVFDKSERYFCEVEIDSDEQIGNLLDVVDYLIVGDKSWYLGNKVGNKLTLVCVESLTPSEVGDLFGGLFSEIDSNSQKGRLIQNAL